MKVLVACEFSGTIRDAFRKRGHEAWSCDLSPTDSNPDYHYQCDVFEVLNRGWDLLIAHPPCTYLSNAGARWLYPKKGEICPERFLNGLRARKFFLELLNANISKICIENPLPSRIFALPKESQVIHPYHFGHPFSKRTHLWLKNLPHLKHTDVVENYTPLIRSNVTDKKRRGQEQFGKYSGGIVTAKTFQGIADAMADQWGQ